MWVEKTQMPVIIFTSHHRIEGIMYTYPDARVLDELNSQGKEFIAITHATVYPVNQAQPLYETEFLALNKTYITQLIPKREILNIYQATDR